MIQKDLTGAADSLGSFMINSTFGVLGLADVASSYGLKDTKEDLSQSLEYMASKMDVIMFFLF